jgi:FkbM family methyltransferase
MKQLVQNLAHRFGYHITRIAEPEPFREIRRLCAGVESPIIFDVGAHDGATALMLSGLFPRSRIYAFEPFPESFATLQRNVAGTKNITPLDYGLSDADGQREFHANSYAATNSLLPLDHRAMEAWPGSTLRSRTRLNLNFRRLDTVVEELGIPKIDVLKLDVQGAEGLVMQGAAAACQKQKIHQIYSEVLALPVYESQPRFDHGLGIFMEAGFRLHSIYNLSHTPDGALRMVDALFVLPSAQP